MALKGSPQWQGKYSSRRPEQVTERSHLNWKYTQRKNRKLGKALTFQNLVRDFCHQVPPIQTSSINASCFEPSVQRLKFLGTIPTQTSPENRGGCWVPGWKSTLSSRYIVLHGRTRWYSWLESLLSFWWNDGGENLTGMGPKKWSQEDSKYKNFSQEFYYEPGRVFYIQPLGCWGRVAGAL